MSDSTTFEDQLERQLRSYAGDGSFVFDGATVARLVAAGVETRRRAATGRWWMPGRVFRSNPSARLALITGIVLVAVIGTAALIGGGLFTTPQPTAEPSASAPGTAVPTASPAATPLASPAATEQIHGWPSAGGSGPGLFSWEGRVCDGHCVTVSTHSGLMHNCNGPCDVTITIDVNTEVPVLGDSVEATIAGRNGWYRRVAEPQPSSWVDPYRLAEEWAFQTDGVWVTLRLWAKPDPSDAGLADAHAIIDSLQYEHTGRPVVGFRLIFRLTNHAWDSG
jgi:hypothetical protein